MRVLVLLALVPLAAAFAPPATTGPGWAVATFDAPADWTIRVEVDARIDGDFAVHGVLLFDEGTRPVWSGQILAPLDGYAETRVRAAGLDVRHGDVALEGSYHSTVLLSCPGCRARTLHVASLVGGDVHDVHWTFDAPEAVARGVESGEGVLALRAEDFAAPLDVAQSLGGVRAQALLDGRESTTIANTLVGSFTDGGALPARLSVTGPDGDVRACPCVFPWRASGPGAYAFAASGADAAGDVLLLVADARLPQ